MILLWGIPADEPMAALAEALKRKAIPYLMLDQQRVLATAIDMRAGADVTGSLRVGEREVRLEDVTAAYVRPWDSQRMRAVELTAHGSAERTHASMVEAALISWSEVTPALVVNRPSSMASNNSKPYQASIIARCGFRTPCTLVTTDEDAVREFQSRHGQIIYKSLSGVRSIVTRLGIDHDAHLPDVANCPTQFQEFVPGIDYRVHVIGSTTYSCTITSSDTDYRYPSQHAPEIRPSVLPPEIEALCLDVARTLGLLVAGLDLRRTSNGEWYCFEANPSPGYTFYQEATGLPMADAIADLLNYHP
jgi:glutathione synthase/RimK-type ligase-like ATP-grasp enzyme